MSKFKKGDKVRVIDIKENEVFINPEMESMLNEIFTIKDVHSRCSRYSVEENEWEWGESNLELVEGTLIKLEDKEGKVIVKTVKDLIDKKIVINCNTEEKANELLVKLDNEGIKWCSGRSTKEYNNYGDYGRRTCYEIGHEGVKYQNQEYYEDVGCKIYRYVSDGASQKVFKVWELEKDIQYREITQHNDSIRFEITQEGLYYKDGFKGDWTDITFTSSLPTILSYEFVKIKPKTQLEKLVEMLMDTYGKEEVERSVQKIRVGDEQ